MFKFTQPGNDNFCITVEVKGIDGFNRGTKINDIETAFEFFRQFAVSKGDGDLFATRFQINRGIGIGQVDDDTAFAFFTTTKINILDIKVGVGFFAGYGCASNLLLCRPTEINNDIISIDAGGVVDQA